MVNGKLNYKGPINNVRAFRLLPLLEKDTNVCVFREADGFVSLNDCHNIKYFAMSQTNKIGMIYEYGLTALNNLIYKQKEEYHHYNTWLNLEKVKLIKSFPDIKETILTLTYPINVLYIEKFGVFNFLDLLGGLFIGGALLVMVIAVDRFVPSDTQTR